MASSVRHLPPHHPLPQPHSPRPLSHPLDNHPLQKLLPKLPQGHRLELQKKSRRLLKASLKKKLRLLHLLLHRLQVPPEGP